MTVLVDTSVWSLALRRRAGALSEPEFANRRELDALIEGGQVMMVGPIRQELLTGIRDQRFFELLRDRLRSFDDVELATADHEEAALISNACRAKGVAGSQTDFLLCAVAVRRGVPIFTADRDFERYARHCELTLHEPR